jgi:peroxiredoxin
MLLALPGAVLSGTADAYRDRSLLDPIGETTSLAAAAHGQTLVVVVMKRSSCPVCDGQLRRLGELHEAIERLDARVVAVAHDRATPIDPSTAAAWPVLADPDHRVIESLGLWRGSASEAMPAILIYDRCGAERVRQTGRWGGARPEAEILAYLRGLAQNPATCPGEA